jgi:hypothetical protein
MCAPTTCTLYSHSTNVPMLIKQKRALVRAIEKAPPKDVELLEGLLNLLDHIHDALEPVT